MSRNRRLKKSFAGVITGASSGIGKATAVLLAKRYGARLVLNARSEESLEETRKLVHNAGGEAVAVVGDVGNTAVAAMLVEKCVEKFGEIDLLMNNAGLAKPGAIAHLTPADWEKVFAVNFFAPLHAIYAALPHFLAKRSGKIVNISSIASKVSFPGSVCYSASKFALTGMSEGMAAELGRMGIDVLTVCPGWVRTEFFEKNNIPGERNPTMIANKADVGGLLMKHVLSISSEKCAADIVKALAKGGSGELIMTAPGVAVERLKALFPDAMSNLAGLVPVDYNESEEKDRLVTRVD
jgi:NAD(P)-dependent dehydrogenase (short-subunit alcohol dehydrogenase family)